MKSISFTPQLTLYCTSNHYLLRSNTGFFRPQILIFCPSNPYLFICPQKISFLHNSNFVHLYHRKAQTKTPKNTDEIGEK